MSYLLSYTLHSALGPSWDLGRDSYHALSDDTSTQSINVQTKHVLLVIHLNYLVILSHTKLTLIRVLPWSRRQTDSQWYLQYST